MRRTMITLIATLAGLSAAHAADPRFCRDYADRVGNEYNRAARLGCPVGGARWNPDQNLAYSWCLRTSYETARGEDAARQRELAQCQNRLEGRRFEGRRERYEGPRYRY